MTAKEQKLGYDSGSVSTLDKVKRFASRNGALIGLIILCIILSIATPAFLTGPNLLNVGIQAATVAILAFGQTFVIVEAGIDLSVGSRETGRLLPYPVCWLPTLALRWGCLRFSPLLLDS